MFFTNYLFLKALVNNTELLCRYNFFQLHLPVISQIMKRLYLFILLLFAGFNLYAQMPLVSFFSDSGQEFLLIINGQKINEVPVDTIEKIGLKNGYAKAKFIMQDTGLTSFEKTISAIDVHNRPAHTSYKIHMKKNGTYTLKFLEYKPLFSKCKPAYLVEKEWKKTKRTKKAREDTCTDKSIEYGLQNDTLQEQILPRRAKKKKKNQLLVIKKHLSDTLGIISPGPAIHAESDVPDEDPDEEICDTPMSHSAFMPALQLIEDKTFDDSKLTIAQMIADANCLLSTQVKQIMELFTYEANRLEFAKYAWHRTYDKGNFFLVNSAFEFEISIDELNEYISEQQN